MNRKLITWVLIAAALSVSFIRVSLKEGEIRSIEDVVRIQVKTNESPVYGVFTWDHGMNLKVRVYGEKRKLIDEVDLSSDLALVLKGGGKFDLELYSEKGTGKWSCKFLNEEDYNK